MQGRAYQRFQDQSICENNYPVGIPVGEPLQNYPILNAEEYPQPTPQTNNYQQPLSQISAVQSQSAIVPLPITIDYNQSMTVTCPSCNLTVSTVIKQQAGTTAYLWSATLFCFINPLCCCIPFLMNSCLDMAHYCPNCGHNVIRKKQRCFDFIGC